tara:strand:+ start:3605 stop:4585 length:981 start_codon:yes stop_codon:yes gene_type:complete
MKLKMKFITRAYNSFSINYKNKSTLIKTSREEKLLNEIDYFRNIPEDLKVYFPRIFNNNTSTSKPYSLEMEYYGYSNLGELMLGKDYSEKTWDKVFDFLFNYINHYKSDKKITSTKIDLKRMFIEKTYKEYRNLINNTPFFKEFTQYEKIYFNDKELRNFNEIWPSLESYIKKIKFSPYFYFIHGDFCFSNILYSENEKNNDVILKFLDPRGKFGNKKFYGEFYYDLAKLNHSTNGGYEFLISNEFDLKLNKNKAQLRYKGEKNKQLINEKLRKKFLENNYDIKKISLIEGLIYIGMCARHYDSLKRQKAMYLIGLDILNKHYEEL